MSLRTNTFILLFRSTIYYWFSFLFDQSFPKWKMLKPPAKIVNLPIFVLFLSFFPSCFTFFFECIYISGHLFSWLLNCGVGEDSWESLGLPGDATSPFWRRSALGFLWKEWCSSWNSSTLATSCEELTHWKRLWCWERLGARREGDDGGWDGWMASLTRWMWVSVNSGSWWWTGRPGMLRFMGSPRVRHDWETDLIWSSWRSEPFII